MRDKSRRGNVADFPTNFVNCRLTTRSWAVATTIGVEAMKLAFRGCIAALSLFSATQAVAATIVLTPNAPVSFTIVTNASAGSDFTGTEQSTITYNYLGADADSYNFTYMLANTSPGTARRGLALQHSASMLTQHHHRSLQVRVMNFRIARAATSMG